MYKTFKFTVAAASLFLGLSTINAGSAQALVNPFNFDVDIDSGPLNGNTYSGSFSYDDATLTGFNNESVPVIDLDYTFDGVNYTDADDVGFGAEVLFNNGQFLGLSYSTNTQFSFVPGFTSTNDSYFTYDVPSGAGSGDITYTATPVPFGVDSTKGILLLGGLFMAKKAINRRRSVSK